MRFARACSRDARHYSALGRRPREGSIAREATQLATIGESSLWRSLPRPPMRSETGNPRGALLPRREVPQNDRSWLLAGMSAPGPDPGTRRAHRKLTSPARPLVRQSASWLPCESARREAPFHARLPTRSCPAAVQSRVAAIRRMGEDLEKVGSGLVCAVNF